LPELSKFMDTLARLARQDTGLLQVRGRRVIFPENVLDFTMNWRFARKYMAG
jgi:hypothetical protein